MPRHRINFLDCLVQRLARRQLPVGLNGEGDHHRHAHRPGSLRHADRLIGIGHGDGRHQIGLGLRKRVDLGCVIGLGRLRAHERARIVAISAWPNAAADDHRRALGLKLQAQPVQEIDGPAVRHGERLRGVAKPVAPIGTSAPCGAFQDKAGAMLPRDGGMTGKIPAQGCRTRFVLPEVKGSEIG